MNKEKNKKVLNKKSRIIKRIMFDNLNNTSNNNSKKKLNNKTGGDINKEYNENIKKYQILNDVFYNDIKSALEIVYNYIIEHKLILVGGQAIDYAIRLKKSKLYEDYVLPDYDFYSPNHHLDAYKIGELLCKAGYTNISVINALHPTTMKVRVNFIPIADITYAPKKVFEKIPYLEYKNGKKILKIINPYYQSLDILWSISQPYFYYSNEAINTRIGKDMKRIKLINEFYPIDKLVQKHKNPFKFKSDNKPDKMKPYTEIAKLMNKNLILIYGITAYKYYQNEFIKEFKNKLDIIKKLPNISKYDDNISVIYNNNTPLNINPKKATYYKPYLDKRFKYIKFEGKNIYKIYISENLITFNIINKHKVVSIFMLCYYFLFDYFENNSIESLYLYNSLIYMGSLSNNKLFKFPVEINKIEDPLLVKNKKDHDYLYSFNKRINLQPKHFYPSDECSVNNEQMIFDTDNVYFDIDGGITTKEAFYR